MGLVGDNDIVNLESYLTIRHDGQWDSSSSRWKSVKWEASIVVLKIGRFSGSG